MLRSTSLLLVTTALLPFGVVAQDASHYQYQRATTLWHNDAIPAGISRDSLRSVGRSLLSGVWRGGSYHHIQEGSREFGGAFFTEQWRPIGLHLYGYGRVSLGTGRIHNRAFADEYRPIFSNPYITGSSIPGKYESQDFDLAARLASRETKGWTFGLGLDYNLGDFSRLKDPRSRINLLDYKFTPSATYRISNNHIIGLGLGYQRRKEKLPSLSTVQDDPNIAYFLMKGLNEGTRTIGGYKGFSRQWVDHRFLANMAYEYTRARFRSMVTLGIVTGREVVSEDKMYQPGKYFTSEYTLRWQMLKQQAKHSHMLLLDVKYTLGSADEYLSQLVTTTDPITKINSSRWDIILIYPKRFQQTIFDAHVDYTYSWDDHEVGRRKAYLGLSNRLFSGEQKYNLPYKRMLTGRMTHAISGGTHFKQGSKGIWTVDGAIGYSYSIGNRLNNIFIGTNTYTDQVLLPLYRHLSQDYAQGKLSVEYQHRLNLGGIERACFIRLAGGLIRTTTSSPEIRSQLSLSIGLYH